MDSNRGTAWRVAGEEIVHCNCDWGCPCQFEAAPTHGRCEAFCAFEIREGHYGDVPLAGISLAIIYSWPGRVDEGNGTRQMIVDDRATDEQRVALDELNSGEHGGGYWEVFAAVCPDRRETLTAPIDFEVDRERRVASLRVGDLLEARAEPITNPVTGEEHRAQIVLPQGFEYTMAEMANTVFGRSSAEEPLAMQLENTYAQLNAFEWTNQT
jgi:hypothetical protein